MACPRFPCAICEENDKKAFYLLKELAPKDNSTANNNLAWMYESGRGYEVDYCEARRLYEKAANLGSSSANWHLGKMYEKGLGVKKILKKQLHTIPLRLKTEIKKRRKSSRNYCHLKDTEIKMHKLLISYKLIGCKRQI